MTFRSRALRRLRKSGRLPSLGQDYDRGHREYVTRMGPEGEQWLRTKPFTAPPSYELARCLHTFAHIVDRLQLPLRAQVLDVGCGPGWLSEYLARCGYWVTGFDISPDMVRIAEERASAIKGPVGLGIEPQAEFHAMHVRELPWRGRFDAAVLYDTMHHFDDELETLQVIRSALVPGGFLYLDEGARPEPGSEGEKVLIGEMEEWGTLESPFDPDYLATVVEEAGFVQIQQLLVVDELIDLADPKQTLNRLAKEARRPPRNTVVAQNPPGPSDEAFAARIEARGQARDGAGEIVFPLTVTNVGSSFWPGGMKFPYPTGTISVGPYVLEGNKRTELARVPLPHSIAAGGAVQVEVQVPRATLDQGRVGVDLVREGIAWFSEPTSPPLFLSLP